MKIFIICKDVIKTDIFHCGAILSSALFISCQNSTVKQENPNIIIIYADDLGYGDLSIYGGDIPSPNIQRIADAGIRFTDFYVSAPISTASRYSLMTGRYPERSVHQLTGALMPGNPGHIDKTEKILPQYLKQFGYRTGIIGKWHLGNNKPEYFPCHYGFDKFVGHTHGCIDFFTHVYGSLGHDWYEDCQPLHEEGYTTELIADHAIKFLSEKKQDPFFLYLPFNAPHYGKSDPDNMPDHTIVLQKGTTQQGINYANTLQAPQKYLDKFTHIEDVYRRYYSAMVSCLDDNIGKILNYLEENHKMENTIIWFISDNGGYSETNFKHSSNGVLRGEKASLTEGGIRIPSVVCWKGVIKPKQVISQPAINIDILPTLLAIVDPSYNEYSGSFDGVSLIPDLTEGKKRQRDLFWKYNKQKAFRRGDWKIYNDELYNLSTDISEQQNLALEKPELYQELNDAWIKMEKSCLSDK